MCKYFLEFDKELTDKQREKLFELFNKFYDDDTKLKEFVKIKIKDLLV